MFSPIPVSCVLYFDTILLYSAGYTALKADTCHVLCNLHVIQAANKQVLLFRFKAQSLHSVTLQVP